MQDPRPRFNYKQIDYSDPEAVRAAPMLGLRHSKGFKGKRGKPIKVARSQTPQVGKYRIDEAWQQTTWARYSNTAALITPIVEHKKRAVVLEQEELERQNAPGRYGVPADPGFASTLRPILNPGPTPGKPRNHEAAISTTVGTGHPPVEEPPPHFSLGKLGVEHRPNTSPEVGEYQANGHVDWKEASDHRAGESEQRVVEKAPALLLCAPHFAHLTHRICWQGCAQDMSRRLPL